MAHQQNAPSTKLCARCSTFQLRDLALGGFAGQAEDGTRVLKFDEPHKPRQFLIRQKIKDTLPDLPALRGCDMCDLLRGSISRAGLDHRGPIECVLRLVWGERDESPERRPGGLMALVMDVFAGDARDLRSLALLQFGICSHDG